MEPESVAPSAGFARLRTHAHLPVVFVAVCVAIDLIERLMTRGEFLSQGTWGAGYLAVLFSVVFPFRPLPARGKHIGLA